MDLDGSAIWQWNARRISGKIPELSILLARFRVPIIVVSETGAKDLSIRGYTDHHSSFRSGNIHASIYVRNDLPHLKINLPPTQDGVDACMVSVKSKVLLHICSVYVDGHIRLDPTFFIELAKKYVNLILLGDFNAHSELWGGVREIRAEPIHKILEDSDLILLNDGSHTYFQDNYSSALDLSFASSSIATSFSWHTSQERLGSDHCLINVHTSLLSDKAYTNRLFHTNWAHFRELSAQSNPCDLDVLSLQNSIHTFMKKATKSRKYVPGCFTKPLEINRLMALRRRLNGQLRRSGDISIRSQINRVTAKLRRLIKQDRRASWKRFCDGIDHRTLDTQIWKRLRTIQGTSKTRSAWLPLLASVQSNSKVAELFLDSFYPLAQSTPRANLAPVHQETTISSADMERLNMPFSLWEIDRALQSVSNRSAPGPDKISYKALSCFADRNTILHILNNIWIEEKFPEEWKTSHVIPILKKGKSPILPSSYRPIALSSCLLKTFERMIEFRVTTALSNSFIWPREMTGFRRNRSTAWNLIDLISTAEEAMARKKHTVAVFFDFCGAFDSVLHQVLLRRLKDLGFNGRLLSFISSYLTKRTVSIKLGSFVSAPRPVHRGVPQGGVLSPILFNLLMRDLPSYLPPAIRFSIYADDVAIWLAGASCNLTNKILQKAIDGVLDFARDQGLSISLEKTVVLPISRARDWNSKINLSLGNHKLKIVSIYKFLGVQIDKNLNFRQHLKETKQEAIRRTGLLRCLSRSTWGATAPILTTFFNALVKSKLLYGNETILTKANTHVIELERALALGLRVISGTPPSTSTNKLKTLLNSESIRSALETRLRTLLLKIKYIDPLHPIHTRLSLFHNSSPTAMIYRSLDLAAIPERPPHLAFWDMTLPTVTMPPFNKKTWASLGNDSCLIWARQWISDLATEGDIQVFADGSFDDSSFKGGAAFVSSSGPRNYFHLPICISSTEAELVAIAEALLSFKNTPGNLQIFTDSKAALQTIANPSPKKHDILAYKIIQLTNDRMLHHQALVLLSWVPGHSGILLNEQADALARQGLSNTSKPTSINNNSLYKQVILHKKRLNIKKSIIPWPKINRAAETIYCRTYVGRLYTRELLYSWNKIESPICRSCNTNTVETTDHLFWECPDRSSERDIFYRKLIDIGLQAPIGLQDIRRIETNRKLQKKKMLLLFQFLERRWSDFGL